MKQDEAQHLALRIETFWHARGYPHIRAIALLTRLANDNREQIWGIRSNLTGREQCETIAVRPGRHRQAA